jgi:hypothetical protein
MQKCKITNIIVFNLIFRNDSLAAVINHQLKNVTSDRKNDDDLWNGWKFDKHRFKDELNKETMTESFPVTQKAAGFSAGLTLLLTGKKDEDPPCPQFDSVGFKVSSIKNHSLGN